MLSALLRKGTTNTTNHKQAKLPHTLTYTKIGIVALALQSRSGNEKTKSELSKQGGHKNEAIMQLNIHVFITASG